MTTQKYIHTDTAGIVEKGSPGAHITFFENW